MKTCSWIGEVIPEEVVPGSRVLLLIKTGRSRDHRMMAPRLGLAALLVVALLAFLCASKENIELINDEITGLIKNNQGKHS